MGVLDLEMLTGLYSTYGAFYEYRCVPTCELYLPIKIGLRGLANLDFLGLSEMMFRGISWSE